MGSKRPQLAPNRYMFMVITVVIVLLTVNSGAAKRGCSMFGHSCYGGFGKRSFQQPAARDWPVTNDEASQIDLALKKYFQVKTSSPHFTPYWQKWVEVYNQHNKLNQPSEDNIIDAHSGERVGVTTSRYLPPGEFHLKTISKQLSPT